MMGRMSTWERKRANGMKSSAVIKCSGQREYGSAPAPGARWVVCFADKCVALTPGEWPNRHRLKQYSHSFIRGFKSPLQQQKLTVARLSPLGWQWLFDDIVLSPFLLVANRRQQKAQAFWYWAVPVTINKSDLSDESRFNWNMFPQMEVVKMPSRCFTGKKKCCGDL